MEQFGPYALPFTVERQLELQLKTENIPDLYMSTIWTNSVHNFYSIKYAKPS